MLWVGAGSRLESFQKNTFCKHFQLNVSQVFLLNISESAELLLSNLKPIIQACFENSRQSYRSLCDKYKSRLSSSAYSAKFLQPWMQNVYYSFKLAFVEELRGDLEIALKYHHSILAKYKQIIEDAKESSDLTIQIFNFLRPSADICFLKVPSGFGCHSSLYFEIAFFPFV